MLLYHILYRAVMKFVRGVQYQLNYGSRSFNTPMPTHSKDASDLRTLIYLSVILSYTVIYPLCAYSSKTFLQNY